ncbi:hypothetical protein ACUUL3_10350 [Thiovibrio sp. JS02]
MRTRTVSFSAFCVFLSLLLGACALPDLQPFADATAQLHTALLETDSAIRRTILEAGARPEEVGQLSKELAVRVAAMKAMVNYTDSLANIATAGRTGSESAGSLASAVDGFLTAFSAPTLPGNYVAMAKSLYGIAAEVRASRSFAKAVAKADPAVQAMAEILMADFHTLEALLAQATVPAQQGLLDLENNAGIVDFREQLEKRRRQLEKALAAEPSAPDLITQLKDINALIDLTRDRYEPLVMQLAAIEERINGQILLVGKSRAAVREWANIHGKLASAVEEGLAPNTRLLAAAVMEIRTLIHEEQNR